MGLRPMAPAHPEKSAEDGDDAGGMWILLVS